MYSAQQQAFTISVLSNNAAGQTGSASSIQSWLQQNVSSALTNSAFTNYIGNWSLVWGPIVWQDTAANSNVADNVLMAAENSDTKDIVVAIAGTNPNSAFDRGTEDLDVGTTVVFDSRRRTSTTSTSIRPPDRRPEMPDSRRSSATHSSSLVAAADSTPGIRTS